MPTCAVIGAGFAGLISMRCALEEGIEPVCFEKNSYMGGLWHYTDEIEPEGSAHVWKGLRMAGGRDNHLISDFPDEKLHKSDFPSHEEMLAYLERYMEKHDLQKYIKLNHKVISVEPDDTAWVVKYRHGNDEISQKFDFVFVATGRFAQPHKLDIPGLEKFKGVYRHSNSFRHNKVEEVVNKKVLVIGAGLSAGEITAIMAETAEQVYLSPGSGVTIFKRTMNDPNPIPIETNFFIRKNCYSNDILGTFGRLMKQAGEDALPNQEKYLYWDKHPLLCGAMISDTLPDCLIQGKVLVRRRCTEITEHGAKFEDGSEVEVDTIWAANGFDISFPFLSKDIINDTTSKMELYKRTWPLTTRTPSLAFVGCTVHGLVPNFSMHELQARWAAQVFTGVVKLPDKEVMRKEIVAGKELVLKNHGKDNGQTDVIPQVLADQMANAIGALPTFWQFAFTDPYVAYILWYGCPYPVQYRLVGRGKWSEARRHLIRMYEIWREQKGDGWSWSKSLPIVSLSVGALACAVLAKTMGYAIARDSGMV